MRLKSIKLAGFKSFVDPTTVPFSGNMSAIIGPNGCGKSNTIDAVRWVMGESSAKNLRGESMTDVIFNGSNARKPVGQATIELVFDNTEGRLKGEYASYSEISIKRKVTREAQNSYYLNGVKCRRRDITDIFLGTGLGPRSYAIIEQGMISKLIESKPEELRVFIEEAAGISKYKERRRDTENRMRRTAENLERLTDIRDELGRQLSHLKRQARAAEQYSELKSQERLLKAQLQAIQWCELDGLVGGQEEHIKGLEQKLEDLVSFRLTAESTIDAQRSEQSELSEKFNQVQSTFYALGAEIARAEQNIQHQKQREEQLAGDLLKVRSSKGDIVEQIALDEEQLETLNEELCTIEPELEILLAGEEESAARLLKAEDDLQQWQQRWDEFNQQAQKPRQTAEVEQSRILHIEQVIRRLEERIHKLDEEQQALFCDADDDDIELLQEQLVESELQEESDQLELDSLQSSIASQGQQLQWVSEALNKNRESYQTQCGRLVSLETLQQAALGQSDSHVGEWLSSAGLSEHKRLGETIRAEPGYEKALETVLGDYLQAVCVDEFSVVAENLHELSKGRVGLVRRCVEGEVAQPISGGQLLADKASGSVAASLLRGIYVVDELSDALVLSERLDATESVVTKEGIWLGKDWLKVNRGDDSEAGIIGRNDEIDGLRQRQLQLSDELTNLELEEKKLRTAIQLEQQQRDDIIKKIKQHGMEKGQISAKLSGLKARLEQVNMRRKSLSADRLEYKEQQQEEQESLAESRVVLQTALDQMERDNALRESLICGRDENRTVLDRIRERVRKDKEGSHQLQLRGQSLNTQLAAISQGLQRLLAQRNQFDETETDLVEALAESRIPNGDTEQELEEALEQRLEIEEQLTQAREALDSIDEQMRENEKKRSESDEQAQRVRGELEKHRLEGQSFDVRRKTLQERLEEADFVLSEVIAGLPEEIDEVKWQEDIQRVGARIQRLGAINLAAIDEYKTQSERKTYLDEQNADLEGALDSLEAAIRRIDKETRNKFKETFDQVNAGLQALFPKVFGGGSAYLELTGDDLLNTGITIMARPPGKKNATIHLLSGGEKALTALALVFSIFQLNPAPFCMLDEVDAPLDDANVARYANIVKEMSATVQFIYITHNKIAMEKSDQLMGVTMQEPGVSRLVTVDIEEAAQLAAM